MDIKGKTILLTGGTSGIGLETCRMLVQRGAHVIVVARDRDRLNALKETPGVAAVHACDLSTPDAIAHFMQTAGDDLRNLDILINNAAIQHPVRLDDPTLDTGAIVSEIHTNFTGPILLTRAVLPILKNRPESMIVTLSSGLAIAPKANAAVYCATKAGLLNFSQGLRNQLQGTHVRVCDILPPIVDTPMTAGRGAGKIPASTVAHAIIDAIENDRMIVPVGKTKILMLLRRISPSLANTIMARLA